MDMWKSDTIIMDIGRCRIMINRISRLICVGRLLIMTGLFGGLAALWFFNQGMTAFTLGREWTEPAVYLLAGFYSALMVVFSVLDLRSRFQDYKRAKDLFFENGFNPRIAMVFVHSRCQRDAVGVAARDLGIGRLLEEYYRSQGYRWYHILPDFIFKRPSLLFSSRYWQRTLFEPSYISSYFQW